MYLIVWEYQVKTVRAAEFERIYASDGPWAKLFQRQEGFLGTQLLRDIERPDRYLTVDRWTSSQEHEAFLHRWKREYAALDAQFERVTEKETLLGKWESVSPLTE
jgi:heme-degrading monooxygenase HmoA